MTTTDEGKTPFILLTGFLGAGKTTLINYILTEQRDKRIAVIENEFGEINIDEQLVASNLASREDIMMMDNGCACCTMRGDLIKTLGQLAEKRHIFDAVILESTGLADPVPIISTFSANAWIGDAFSIDSVICLADAKHVQLHLDEVKPEGAINEAVQQVMFADRILLNKTDLVNADELEAIQDTLKSINHFAEIIQCQRSRVDLSRILGLNSFAIEKCLELDPNMLDALDEADDDGAPAEGGEKKRRKKIHDLSMVSSLGFKIEGNMDVQSFNLFMAELLQTRSEDIYRSKGVVAFEGQGDQKFVFQGVHEQIDFGPAPNDSWKPDEPRINKIVFIGRGLDRKALGDGLRMCLHSVVSGGAAAME